MSGILQYQVKNAQPHITYLLPSIACAFVHHIKRCNTSSFHNVVNVSENMSQIFCCWLLGRCDDGFLIQHILIKGKVGQLGPTPGAYIVKNCRPLMERP